MCARLCWQLAANVAPGLLAKPGPSRGVAVSDPAQRVRPGATVALHPEAGCK